MNYDETRAYIDSISKYGSILGLENIRELLQRVGNPQDHLRFVHVAGTNGKGSTVAFLSTILKEAGYRVGRFISPTIYEYEERFQINGENISREYLASCMTVVAKAAEQMQNEGRPHPTIFEVETAVAFLYFYKEHCDLVVLETGMGGEQDATNIIRTAELSIITSISMDHKEWLGTTLAEIARNKAGIMKENVPVITVPQPPEVMEILLTQAKKRRCPFAVLDPDKIRIHYSNYHLQNFDFMEEKDLFIWQGGLYQIQNACLAVRAAIALRRRGFTISKEQLRKGLEDCRWPGRFTVLGEEPIFIMDGAHNPDGVRQLTASIEKYFTNQRITYIMGVFADKDYKKMAELIAPTADKIYTITPPLPNRALPAHVLADAVKSYCNAVEPVMSLEEAVEKSLRDADGEHDVVVAFGSLSYLGALDRVVQGRKEKTDG